MAITLPTTYQRQSLRELSARSPILAPSWSADDEEDDYGLAEALHLLWARSVSRFGGGVFDPPFTAEVSNYSQTDPNNDYDLGIATLSATCERTDDSGAIVVELAAVSIASDLRARIYNASTGALVGTVVASNGATLGLAVGRVTLSDALDANGDPYLLYAVLDAKTDDDSLEALYAFSLYEATDVAVSDLPR